MSLDTAGADADAAADGQTLASPPALAEIGRVITVGGGALVYPSWSRSAGALLVTNDDARFPAFAGHDLSTLLGNGAEFIRLERAGDSFHALGAAAVEGASAPGTDSLSGVDPAATEPTLVIVALTTQDLVYMLLRITQESSLRDDQAPLLTEMEAHLATVLGFVNSDTFLARRPLLAVVNAVDPTDGSGELAALIDAISPIQGLGGLLEPDMVLATLTAFNAAIASATRAAGGTLVDAHAAFMGNAAQWRHTPLELDARGAHELRRAIWNALTDAPITVEPPALPSVGAPAAEAIIADAGWANEVAVDAVTKSLVLVDVGEVPSSAQDATQALGPQTAVGASVSTTTVALGVLGGSLTLDMGASEQGYDGPGYDLYVREQGPSLSGSPEPYRVEVAAALDGPWHTVGDATGVHLFDLEPVGPGPFRYVRLTSLAHYVDVVSGLGSPLFPGGEIDAVGVVYPGAP